MFSLYPVSKLGLRHYSGLAKYFSFFRFSSEKYFKDVHHEWVNSIHKEGVIDKGAIKVFKDLIIEKNAKLSSQEDKLIVMDSINTQRAVHFRDYSTCYYNDGYAQTSRAIQEEIDRLNEEQNKLWKTSSALSAIEACPKRFGLK